ncbi:guanylate cyclase [Anopheles sinensis]|uniref:Guanylate cyclase n=1 Tax=Anopheles sinensis TaxID=74873 RepID=A0A084VG94_ANOSI|nr:guanylate cyclase [Anopheles sinensis]
MIAVHVCFTLTVFPIAGLERNHPGSKGDLGWQNPLPVLGGEKKKRSPNGHLHNPPRNVNCNCQSDKVGSKLKSAVARRAFRVAVDHTVPLVGLRATIESLKVTGIQIEVNMFSDVADELRRLVIVFDCRSVSIQQLLR